MKKLIIRMINCDEYHIKESENFNKKYNYTLEECAETIRKALSDYMIVSKENGYEITYASGFAIDDLEEVTIRLKYITSIDLVEERKND